MEFDLPFEEGLEFSVLGERWCLPEYALAFRGRKVLTGEGCNVPYPGESLGLMGGAVLLNGGALEERW